MAEQSNEPGRIVWVDLTVPEAENVRDFYSRVVGWHSTDFDMGGYSDYCMHPDKGADPVAGVVNARGVNADLPPVWLIYVRVADLDASLEAVRSGGGEVVAGPKPMGEDRYAVVRDPAGAMLGLIG